MASSLSNLVNNLAEGFHKIKCKYGYNDKKCETFRIKYKHSNCFHEYASVKDDLIEYKCLCCNNNYQKKFDENLRKSFIDTYKFFHQDINKFILLLRKGDYPYEYMDDWKKFNEISLPEKEDFYSHLNIEDITNENYMHEKRILK